MMSQQTTGLAIFVDPAQWATPSTTGNPGPGGAGAVIVRVSQYPSKLYPNSRAHKRNGELHHFCEDHRIRVNTNQKRWSSTRQHKWELPQHQANAEQARALCEPLATLQFYTNYPAPSYEGGDSSIENAKHQWVAQRGLICGVERAPSQTDRLLPNLLFRSQSSTDDDRPFVSGSIWQH